jgi:hypothetical protein
LDQRWPSPKLRLRSRPSAPRDPRAGSVLRAADFRWFNEPTFSC